MTSPLASMGPTRVQSVVGALETAIRRGRLPPGHELSIRQLADRHGVKVSALVLALGRLIDDRLIFLYGDTAVVSTLRSDESARLNELYEMIVVSLSDRLFGAISPTRLDELEAMVATVDPDRAGLVPAPAWGHALSRFSRVLLEPVVADVERRTLEQISDATHRYIMLGWSVVQADAGQDRDQVILDIRREHIGNIYRKIDSYRGGSRQALRENLARCERDRMMLCQASLTRDHTRPALRIVR